MAEKVVIVIDDDEDEPKARPKDNEVIIIDNEGSTSASISGTNLYPPSRKRHRILSTDDDVQVTAFEPKRGWRTNPTIEIQTGGLRFPASGCSKCSASNTNNKGSGSSPFGNNNYQVALQLNGGITPQQSSVVQPINPHAITSPGCRTPINTCTPVCSVTCHSQSTPYTPKTSLTNYSITPTPPHINTVHVHTPLSTVKQPGSSKKSRSKSKRRQKSKAKTVTKTGTSQSGDESDYKSSLSIPMFCIRSTGDISTLPPVTQFIASSSVPFISCDAPPWWSESKLFDISLEDPEARTVVYPLEYSGFQVLKVERIQTLHLWIRYLSEVKLLVHSRGEHFKLNEALLYHCSRGSKDAICEEGLDVRLTHGGNFGRGIYFRYLK